MKASSILRRLALIVVLLISAYSISSAVTMHGWAKNNGVWVYGALISDKGIVVVDGVTTVAPPWSFVGADGKTITGSYDKESKIEWSWEKPESEKSRYKLDISNANGVSIESENQLSIFIYDIENSSFVLQKERVNTISLTPNQELNTKKLYLMVVIDKDGNEDVIKFMIGEN